MVGRKTDLMTLYLFSAFHPFPLADFSGFWIRYTRRSTLLDTSEKIMLQLVGG